MLQAAFRYWCLVLLCSMMSSSAFCLPHFPNRVPSLQHIARVLEKDGHDSRMVKRAYNRAFQKWSMLMAKQRRYNTEQAAIQKMFHAFDMNSDGVIEQDEFRAALKILGISRRRY